MQYDIQYSIQNNTWYNVQYSIQYKMQYNTQKIKNQSFHETKKLMIGSTIKNSVLKFKDMGIN